MKLFVHVTRSSQTSCRLGSGVSLFRLAQRLIILSLISTLLFSCGGENPAANGAGIVFQAKWPAAKSVASVPAEIPPGVVKIRMSVSGFGMATISKDFEVSPTSPRTGSIEGVPVGINRTITLQGLASNGDIIFQDVVTNVTLKSLSSSPPYSHRFDMKLVAASNAPAAPSGLSATAVSTSQIDLAWVNNANNDTGYIIERKTEVDTNYTQIATVAANNTMYTDSVVSANTTYTYQVRPINDVINSGEAFATTSVAVPANTYGISGTITTGSPGAPLAGATITRYWNGSMTKTTDSTGNYRFDGTQNGSYTLTPAKAGYSFEPPNRLVTVNGSDLSAINFVATVVGTVPTAPSGLSARVYASNLIYLSWVDTNNETGYTIERKEGTGGTYTPIATVAANVTTYSDTTVSASTTYFYRLRAKNGFGDSVGYSNEANIITPTPTYSISGVVTSGGVPLAGVAVSLAGSVSSAATTNSLGSYSFSGVPDGGYTLTLAGMPGYIFNSASLNVTVNGSNLTANNFEATAIPVMPTGLKVAAVSPNLINITWSGVNNKSGYEIERTEGAAVTTITVASGVFSYRDVGLLASTAYSYRVRAVIGAEKSEYSAPALATTLAAGSSSAILPELVAVGSFSIGKYEVTQGEWMSVMGSNPSFNSSCGDNCPVENVSWDDVQNYITTLKNRSGINYRLPTKSEWQYAAQSGGLNEVYSGGNDVNAVAWYVGNSGGASHQVGQKQPNGLGIYDMSGNVSEWVNDLYGSTNRVFRGGSWVGPADFQKATYGAYFDQKSKNKYLGFRLAAD